jgi:hypothetical protein
MHREMAEIVQSRSRRNDNIATTYARSMGGMKCNQTHGRGLPLTPVQTGLVGCEANLS